MHASASSHLYGDSALPLVHFEDTITLAEGQHGILAQTATVRGESAAHDPYTLASLVSVADDAFHLHESIFPREFRRGNEAMIDDGKRTFVKRNESQPQLGMMVDFEQNIFRQKCHLGMYVLRTNDRLTSCTDSGCKYALVLTEWVEDQFSISVAPSSSACCVNPATGPKIRRYTDEMTQDMQTLTEIPS